MLVVVLMNRDRGFLHVNGWMDRWNRKIPFNGVRSWLDGWMNAKYRYLPTCLDRREGGLF